MKIQLGIWVLVVLVCGCQKGGSMGPNESFSAYYEAMRSGNIEEYDKYCAIDRESSKEMLAENPEPKAFLKTTWKERAEHMDALDYQDAVIKDSIAYIRGKGEYQGELWYHLSVLGKAKDGGWEVVPGGELSSVQEPKAPF